MTRRNTPELSTSKSDIDYSHVDLDALLKQRRQVAHIWCVEDVQEIRSDFTDDQAWEVLQRCYDKLDSERGFTWEHIETIADEMFPQTDDE